MQIITKNSLKTTLFIIIICFCFSGKSFAQIAESWNLNVNGTGDYSDKFLCLNQDATGNYIAAGSSIGKSTNRDFLVVKYNATGDTLWTFTLDGGFGGPDEITSVALDNAGNVFATGFAKGYYTGYDILTIKLNSAGDTVWTKKFNYTTANEDDIPVSIALDNAGNIVVAGYSDSDPSSIVSNDDVLTLKYSGAGSLLWTQRYNGLNNGIDRACKVSINTTNDIYIGGRVDNGDDDYLLIKYSSAGSQTWLRSFDNGSNDRGITMAMDATGNCYLSGRSSNGTDHDIVTLKYNSTGTILYTATYDYVGDDRATAITVDATGNAYVTGQSDGDLTANRIFDFVTIKYNTTGVQQWATRYAGSAGGDDIPESIAVTAAGEVWVTGISDADATTAIVNDWISIKYNATGVQQFVKTEGTLTLADEGAACIVDASNRAIVVGFKSISNQQPDATLIRFTSDGTKELEKNYSGIGDNQDQINAMCFSSDGSILGAGFSVEKDLDPNMCITKTSLAGALVWKKTLSGNSSTGSTDNAMGIVCDASGNIYATGYTKNSNAGSDFTTIKLNQAGDTIWTRKYSFVAGATDRAISIALDPQNNIVITGYSDSDPAITTNYDFTTVKYNAAGTQLWAVRYNGTLNLDDKPVAMAIAPSGNIYVAGRTFNGVDDDMLLVKYNSNGIVQWTHTWNGGSGDDRNTAIVLDASENCYISGRTFSGTDLNGVLVKVTSAGQTAWFRTYNNTGISDDRFSDVAINDDGMIIVTGQADIDPSITTNLDLTLCSWAPDGTAQWTQTFSAPGAVNEYATCLTIKPGGIIIAGGGATNSNGKSAPLTVRFDSLGNVLWYGLPNLAASLGGEVDDIIFSSGSVYTGGFLEKNPGMSNLHYQKYSDLTTGIPKVDNSMNVWPSPVQDNLFVRFNNQEIPTSVAVRDALGRIVFTTNGSDLKSAGSISVKDWDAGIYYLTISFLNKIKSTPFIVQ